MGFARNGKAHFYNKKIQEMNMPDDLTRIDGPDSKRINKAQDYELKYEAEKMNVAKDDIKNAIEKTNSTSRGIYRKRNKK